MRTRVSRDDAGLGMVELAVAMLLLGLILMALAPLMLNSILLAKQNSDVGQANLVVASNIELARIGSVGGTCDNGVFTGVTPRGGLFETPSDRFEGDVRLSCDASADGLVTVHVSVWRASDPAAKPISEAWTKVVAS